MNNIRRLLETGSEVERVLACINAMLSGTSDLIPFVTQLLHHDSPTVRAVALETLGEIEGDWRFAAKAAALLERETNPVVSELAGNIVERWNENHGGSVASHAARNSLYWCDE